MVEASISVAIAACTGLSVLCSRLHGRIHELDKRIDQVELRVAEKYVPRVELSAALQRFENHMIRIEDKLDDLVANSRQPL